MFEKLDLLQIYPNRVSRQAIRATRFTSLIAHRIGASCFRQGAINLGDDAYFYDIEEEEISSITLNHWAIRSRSLGRTPIIIRAGLPGDASVENDGSASLVSIEMETWQSEETLFAGSGLAELLGDPEREPLVPSGNYAAHTIGYSAFCAVSGLYSLERRLGRSDCAVVNGEGVLAWVNWKAALAGALGKTLKREGKQAEWPILHCRDGDTAFLFTERDWDKVVDMIGDPSLEDEKFSTFEGRNQHREEYMSVIRQWCTQHTKAELTKLFEDHQIPSAPTLTLNDLLTDPLLEHRSAFETHQSGQRLPRLPHRIEHSSPASKPAGRPAPSGPNCP